jgi:hypothetical protein
LAERKEDELALSSEFVKVALKEIQKESYLAERKVIQLVISTADCSVVLTENRLDELKADQME